jgi:hypothetical protein
VVLLISYSNCVCKQNLLCLNYQKTRLLHFKIRTSNSIDINMDHMDEPISKVQNVKYFDLMLDDTLSWKSHVDHLESKLSSACFVLRILWPLGSEGTLRIVYFSYIHSILSYGIIFWANCSDSNKIFKLQKRAIRILGLKIKNHAGNFSRN